MTCPVHGGSLKDPCHCEPTVNDRRVAALVHAHTPRPSVLNDGVAICDCGWLSTDPAWLHIENAKELSNAG